MRFKHVEIQNFLSFGQAIQKVDLDNRGLVAVFGRNLTSSSADSNGSGKSSILEAIIWALYGETMREYTGDQVVNSKTGADCLVRLVLEDDSGRVCTIERTRAFRAKKPNDLRLFMNGVDASMGVMADTQHLINLLIGMDSRTFTQSVMLYSRGRSFSSMTDREQKEVLDDILQIEILSRAKDVAKSRVTDRTNELAQVRTHIASFEEQIKQCELRKGKLVLLRDQHAELTTARRLELLLRRSSLETRLEELNSSSGLSDLMRVSKVLMDDLSKQEEIVRVVQGQELTCVRSFGELAVESARQKGHLRAKLGQADFDSRKYNDLAGTACPHCKQIVAPEFAESCIELFQKEKDAINQALAKVTHQEEENEKKKQFLLESCELKISRAKKEVAKLSAEYAGVVDLVQKRRSEFSQIPMLEQQIASVEEEIATLDKMGNPYTAMVDSADREITAHEDDLRFLRYKDAGLSSEVAHLTFWVSAFGNQGMKSHLLDSVIPFLTQRAQHYADILSDGDIRIEFFTQAQTKAGTWKEQFNVRATNRFGADVYEGNSDGEKRRVDLAVGWALGDLAASRAKKAIRFKGLDEPFVNLDATGEDAVVRLLHKVVDQYETVMCITHSEYLQSQFRNCLTVVKDSGGSHIQ